MRVQEDESTELRTREGAFQEPGIAFMVGLLMCPTLTVLVGLGIGFDLAWFSAACNPLIAFFMWLVALGYQDRAMARGVVIGFIVSLVLSGASFLLFRPS
ncbi:MAG: hypothetical protein MK235_01820 [Candidatus Poseidoniales archaeon]|nr:hypothetical protein [Candidatus Poseidoniales archaeon]